jgi:hypothetical protein
MVKLVRWECAGTGKGGAYANGGPGGLQINGRPDVR